MGMLEELAAYASALLQREKVDAKRTDHRYEVRWF